MIDLMVQAFRSKAITNPTHLLVCLALARRCGSEDGVCYAKQTTLAADTRLHSRTVGKVLEALEANDPPLIKRIKHPQQADGKRRSDDIYLTLPEVVLEATKPVSPVSKTSESTTHSPVSPRLNKKRPIEDTIEDSVVGFASDEPVEDRSKAEGVVDLKAAVEMIWRAAGEMGRKRSAKLKVTKALKSALARRAKGQTEEDRLRLIFTGYRAYLESDEVNGRFEGGEGAMEKGIHRMIENDAWEAWVTPGAASVAISEPEIVDPDLGTMEKPGPKRQRMWMELYTQGMSWPSDRGPRPGMPDCRVDPALQAEFGIGPAAKSIPDVL